MTDFNMTVYFGNWEFIERKDCITLRNEAGTVVVLSPQNAREVWQALNAWVERNATIEEVE